MQALLSLEELESRAAGLGASPRDRGTLEMIVSRPDVDERVVLDEAEIDLDDGLVGDNWRVHLPKPQDEAAHIATQVTIMNSRVIHLLAQDRSRWALAGDQLYVDLDISHENLPEGQRLAIGAVILEVTDEPHTGCAKFAARFGPDARSFVNTPQGRRERRRGLNARVIQPGKIKVGDIVSKIS